TLSYNRTFNQDHRVTLLLGYTIQKEVINTESMNGTGFPGDDVTTLNAASIVTGSTGIAEWSMLSYLSRINYAFRDRYLLTATLRRDGSSRFGSNNKWGLFPSGSIGWRISQEEFMKNLTSVSDLKVRASYGLAGN